MSSNPQRSLDELSSAIGKEMDRLGRLSSIEAKQEIQFRIWPFLDELIQAIEAGSDDDDNDAALPLEPALRWAEHIVQLATAVRPQVPAEAQAAFDELNASVVNDILSYVDQDELATHVETLAASKPAAATEAVSTVADATAAVPA